MRLRKINEFDLEQRVAWMNDPRVYRFMHFVPPITLENTQKWYKNNIEDSRRFDGTFVDDDGELLAFVGLTNIDWSVRKAEFYIFVNPEIRGRGVGTEAARLLLRYGFEELRLHKIFLLADASNVAARKTYEKVGFKLEGIHREENIVDTKYEDRLYYGILAKDFEPRNDASEPAVWDEVLLDECRIDGLLVKLIRDDIYPQIGGGIKARKAMSYEAFLRRNGYDAIVTCGGIQSNHNRAMALMCARNGWRCHLCIQGTEERFLNEKGNALCDRLSGAECELICPEDTSEAMNRAMDRLRSEGRKPYYVHGGGHDLHGGICFVNAVKNLKAQCDREGYKPDYMFIASGTGSTQAGIAVGLDMVGWSDVKLVGISVSRTQERGRKVIVDFANMLAGHYGMPQDYDDKIEFIADYLMGGYEQCEPEVKEYLDGVMAKTGILFDTTYSGKGLWGMMQEVKRRGLQDRKIMFWHTGGVMNIMK